jgi:pimeloyl-ACP methyl ester carboxylesterase
MTKRLYITDQQGRKLAALYDEPTTTGPYPLVLLLHGNTGWKEEEHLATLAINLATAGIAALRFDAPGSGESGGTWEKDYRVSNYLADVGDVYDYACQKLAVDTNHIGIWGHSMGGMVAIYAAAAHPEHFQAVCACQPSPGQMSQAHAPASAAWEERGGAHIETEKFGTIWLPAEFFAERAHYNTAHEVNRLQASLLLIDGLDDRFVTAASVRAIFEAAPEPKQLLEFPTDHYFKRDSAVLADVNVATLAFFQTHLITKNERPIV